MFWPADAFDEEYRETVADVNNRGQEKAIKKQTWSFFTKMSGPHSDVVPANSWWIARRRTCYVGVFCSRDCKVVTHSAKDSVYEVLQEIASFIIFPFLA
jgi:hypothetical protein